MNRPLLYDWMRGGTIAVALCALQFLEMSRVYHYIRGQAMVKLYVLTAMMEIFDKVSIRFILDFSVLLSGRSFRKVSNILLYFDVLFSGIFFLEMVRFVSYSYLILVCCCRCFVAFFW